jgi:hypothetical protein
MPIVQGERLDRNKALPDLFGVEMRRHEVHEADKAADGDFDKTRDKMAVRLWMESSRLGAAVALRKDKVAATAAAAAAAIAVAGANSETKDGRL